MPDPMPRRPPTGKIAFAAIRAETLVGNAVPLDALEAALVPGTMVERHNRSWRLGQWQREGQAIVGRIGFEAPSLTELWDDRLGDFTETARPAGLTSPFAIDVSTLRVAFQVRGSVIKVNSFTGAMRALLNEASPIDRWRVDPEATRVSLAEWVEQTDRITAVHATLERPNPHYADRDRVRAIIDGTNARLAELALRADPTDPQGLDMRDPLIREAVDHAEEQYGTFTAIGERGNEKTQWSSKSHAAAEIREAPADPVTHELSTNALRQELGDPTAEAEAVRDAWKAREALEEMGDELDDVFDDDADDDQAA